MGWTQSSKRPIEVLESDSEESQCRKASKSTNPSPLGIKNPSVPKAKHPRVRQPQLESTLPEDSTTPSNQSAQPSTSTCDNDEDPQAGGYPLTPREEIPSGHTVSKKEFMQGLKNVSTPTFSNRRCSQ